MLLQFEFQKIMWQFKPSNIKIFSCPLNFTYEKNIYILFTDILNEINTHAKYTFFDTQIFKDVYDILQIISWYIIILAIIM